MINFANLDDIVKNIDNIYAHISNGRKETLREHLNNCAYLVNYINSLHKLESKLRKVFLKLDMKYKGKNFSFNKEEIDFIIDLFFNAIYLHDIGKINPQFQVKKMNNLDFINVKNLTLLESHHAPISAIIYINEFSNLLEKIYINEFYNKSENETLRKKALLRMIMLYFANTIYCHHGSLQELEDNFSSNKLEEVLNTYTIPGYLMEYKQTIAFDKGLGSTLDKIKRNNIKFNSGILYVITKILNSLLIATDFTSTHCFYKNINVSDFKLELIEDVSAMIDSFEKTDVFKGMMEYSQDKDYFKKKELPLINGLRSDIALECRSNIETYKSLFNIFNIEAPTGSGKTYNSLGCVLKLLESGEFKKFVYISPINAVSNQTKDELRKIFGKVIDVEEINSLTPFSIRTDNNGNIDYEKTLLDKQLFNYPVTLTSHVSFFNMMFGTSRESSMGLFQFFDSVVVLDEIQNYKNSIWQETIEMLYLFSDIMNIKIIIMSATLPNLEELISFKSNKFLNLISDPKNYYRNPLFRDRVTIDGQMLGRKVDFAEMKKVMTTAINKRHINHSDRGQIFLAEFIRKSTSLEFYEKIKTELSPMEYEIYQLDGNNSSFSKSEIIDKIKNYNGSKHLILITTQVIEAGVDIDADLGMKDAVFPDVDEQFMGRINRSGKKEDCVVFFFNYDNEAGIYKGDLRLGTNIKDEKFMNCLEYKNFRDVLYKEVLERIPKLKDNSILSDIEQFHNKELFFQKFYTIEDRMKLIENLTINIYIPIKNMMIKDKTGRPLIINGNDIWNEYSNLVEDKNMRYSEKRVKIASYRENMSLFTYSLYGKAIKEVQPVGGIYYIPNGETFLKNGKLDIDTFNLHYTIDKLSDCEY